MVGRYARWTCLNLHAMQDVVAAWNIMEWIWKLETLRPEMGGFELLTINFVQNQSLIGFNRSFSPAGVTYWSAWEGCRVFTSRLSSKPMLFGLKSGSLLRDMALFHCFIGACGAFNDEFVGGARCKQNHLHDRCWGAPWLKKEALAKCV